ncbi:hypothetical protein [Flavonifractor sp. An306]|uniref:hypothetical protein n=1 Tax=Flavonifractor sp. An306 TaxID=1965629 RepID=UPI00174A64DB|nr:hypothetical protein [Flavonifractor sp. An306]
MDKRFDDYEEIFLEEGDLLLAVQDMESNSEWIPGVPRTSLTVLPLDAPMFVQEAVNKYGLDQDVAMDTVDDTRSGTHLLVQYQNKVWCLRDTGRSTLYTSAGQIGPANANMVRAQAYSDLAQSMNIGLKYAKGNALLLVRYGKLSALHSGAADGYAVMPISELLAATKRMLNRRFGMPKFVSGLNSHSYTYATWELPDVQSALVEKYQQALSKAVSHHHSTNWMPVVRFSSSDTATSSAVLMPKLRSCGGGYAFSFVKGIRVEHTIKTSGSEYGLDKFATEAEGLYALFEDGAKMMEELGKQEIANPVNCLVGICAQLKIPRKYADPARDEIETFAISTPRMSALDIYLSLAQVPAYAEKAGASQMKILELEETVAKILNMDMSDYDIGGTVSW